jgi:hypothetical protein
MKSNA